MTGCEILTCCSHIYWQSDRKTCFIPAHQQYSVKSMSFNYLTVFVENIFNFSTLTKSHMEDQSTHWICPFGNNLEFCILLKGTRPWVRKQTPDLLPRGSPPTWDTATHHLWHEHQLWIKINVANVSPELCDRPAVIVPTPQVSLTAYWEKNVINPPKLYQAF